MGPHAMAVRRLLLLVMASLLACDQRSSPQPVREAATAAPPAPSASATLADAGAPRPVVTAAPTPDAASRRRCTPPEPVEPKVIAAQLPAMLGKRVSFGGASLGPSIPRNRSSSRKESGSS